MNRKLAALLCAGFMIWIPADLEAQRSRPREAQERFADKLWYGGNFGLSISSSSLAGLSGNVFTVSLAPMVGYEVFENVSVGPRLEFIYFNGRYEDPFVNSGIFKLNVFNIGFGPFARYKFLRNFFAHIEYQYLSEELPVDIDAQTNKIITVREGNDRFFIGGGYTSGSRVASEIYILYDVLAAQNTVELPVQYRFGITFNF